jgi:hypothetical protein
MKPLHVVLACILVDMIGVGLVIPTLPQLSESLGGTTAQYGWVGTAYGTLPIQFVHSFIHPMPFVRYWAINWWTLLWLSQ